MPCMNLVWGDVSGSIGYKLVGKLPRRRGGCPDLPKPGWTGEYEWDGYVPFDELPEIVDPPGGRIVTANNRVAPDDYPHHITSEYTDGYRAARIDELLEERQHRLLELWDEGDTDLLGGREWDELALASLRAGLGELTERFGDDPGGWLWGRVHGLRFVHPLGDGESPASTVLDRVLSRRVPAGGSQ